MNRIFLGALLVVMTIGFGIKNAESTSLKSQNQEFVANLNSALAEFDAMTLD